MSLEPADYERRPSVPPLSPSQYKPPSFHLVPLSKALIVPAQRDQAEANSLLSSPTLGRLGVFPEEPTHVPRWRSQVKSGDLPQCSPWLPPNTVQDISPREWKAEGSLVPQSELQRILKKSYSLSCSVSDRLRWPSCPSPTSSDGSDRMMLTPSPRAIARHASVNELRNLHHREALIIDSQLVHTPYSRRRRWSISTPNIITAADIVPSKHSFRRMNDLAQDEVDSDRSAADIPGGPLPKIKLSNSENTLAVSIPSAETSSDRRLGSPSALAIRRGKLAPASLSFETIVSNATHEPYPELPTPFLFSPPADAVTISRPSLLTRTRTEGSPSLDMEDMIGQLHDMIRTLQPATPSVRERPLPIGESREPHDLAASDSTGSVASAETQRSKALSLVSEDEWAFARDLMAESGDPLPPRAPKSTSRLRLEKLDSSVPPVPKIPSSLKAAVKFLAAPKQEVKSTPTTVSSVMGKPLPKPKSASISRSSDKAKLSATPKDSVTRKNQLPSRPSSIVKPGAGLKQASTHISSDWPSTHITPRKTPSPIQPSSRTSSLPVNPKSTPIAPKPLNGLAPQAPAPLSIVKICPPHKQTPAQLPSKSDASAPISRGNLNSKRERLATQRTSSPSNAASRTALVPEVKARTSTSPITLPADSLANPTSTCSSRSCSRSRISNAPATDCTRTNHNPVQVNAQGAVRACLSSEQATPVSSPRDSAPVTATPPSQPRGILKQPKSVRFAEEASEAETSSVASLPRFPLTPPAASVLDGSISSFGDDSPTRPPPRVMRTKKAQSAQLIARRGSMMFEPVDDRRRSLHASSRPLDEPNAGDGGSMAEYVASNMDIAGTPGAMNGGLVAKGRRSFSLLSPSGDKENRFKLSIGSNGPDTQTKRGSKGNDSVPRKDVVPRKSPLRSILGKLRV